MAAAGSRVMKFFVYLWLRWPRVLFLVGGLALLGTGFLFGASKAEEQDGFCISCHVAPEQTYYDRSRLALAQQEPYLDLSSAHYGLTNLKGNGFRGRDGPGVGGRRPTSPPRPTPPT